MAPKRNDKYTRWKCKCSCGNIVEVRGDYLISGHTTSCGCQKGKRELPNHIGEKFGDWTIISKGTKTSYWLCKCSCGIEREVFYPSLQKGLSTSCGHKNKELKGPRKSINGNRYGNLVVIEQFVKNGEQYCKCKCDCGNITEVKRGNLTSGNTKSCGCIISYGEAKIKQILEKNNISFIAQWTPLDISNKRYRYDFFLPDLNIVIEFDGPQHSGQVSGYYTKERIDQLLKRDQEKNQYCLEHNIPLYRIPYKYRDSITLELLTNEQFRVKESAAAPDMEEAQEENIE